MIQELEIIRNEILIYIAYKEGLLPQTDYLDYIKSQIQTVTSGASAEMGMTSLNCCKNCEALKTINDIYSGFEELISQIEQEDDTANAQERIDEWCNNKLRSIIANHYLNRMIEILKGGDLTCQQTIQNSSTSESIADDVSTGEVTTTKQK